MPLSDNEIVETMFCVAIPLGSPDEEAFWRELQSLDEDGDDAPAPQHPGIITLLADIIEEQRELWDLMVPLTIEIAGDKKTVVLRSDSGGDAEDAAQIIRHFLAASPTHPPVILEAAYTANSMYQPRPTTQHGEAYYITGEGMRYLGTGMIQDYALVSLALIATLQQHLPLAEQTDPQLRNALELLYARANVS